MLMGASDEVVWITAGGTRDMGSPEQAWSHPEFARDYLGRRGRTALRSSSESDPGDSEPNRGGPARPTAQRAGWTSRLRHVWVPLAGAAAGIWVTVRIAMTAFGSAVRALPQAGDDAVSLWAAGAAGPVVAVCVVLAWIDHLRRGADAWLPTLGVGRRRGVHHLGRDLPGPGDGGRHARCRPVNAHLTGSRRRSPGPWRGDRTPLHRRVPILVLWTVCEAVRREPAVLPVVPRIENGTPNRGTIERRGKDNKTGNHRKVLASRERPGVGSGADRTPDGPHRRADRALPGSSQGSPQSARTAEDGGAVAVVC